MALPFSNKEGSADPLVTVKVLGKEASTNYCKETLAPIFNETLFFSFNNLSMEELTTAEIEIGVYDHNTLSKDAMIGMFSVDLSFVYELNKDHEIYRKWVILQYTTDESEGIQGYLRVSVSVLGPGDKPAVHDPSKNLKDRNDNNPSNIFAPGRVKTTGHIIKVSPGKNENALLDESLPRRTPAAS